MPVFSRTDPHPVVLPECPLAVALDALGGKWKLPLLWWLGRRPRHFNELHRLLPGISHKVLTEQLRDLEAEGLVDRTVRKGAVTRVRYSLTPAAASLEPILQALCAWGTSHARRRAIAEGG